MKKMHHFEIIKILNHVHMIFEAYIFGGAKDRYSF